MVGYFLPGNARSHALASNSAACLGPWCGLLDIDPIEPAKTVGPNRRPNRNRTLEISTASKSPYSQILDQKKIDRHAWGENQKLYGLLSYLDSAWWVVAWSDASLLLGWRALGQSRKDYTTRQRRAFSVVSHSIFDSISTAVKE